MCTLGIYARDHRHVGHRHPDRLRHHRHADALDDIKKAGKIRIAIDLGVPPYGMTDDKLQPTGLDVETARLLAKDWGLEFEHVPTTGRVPD